jgi:hypothetical protein
LLTCSARSPFLDIIGFPSQISGDFAELFEGGFEIFDDFLRKNVGFPESSKS